MANYKKWLEKTHDDLLWTKHNIKGTFYSQACFSSQQAAEKALKAFMLYHHKPLRKIHDLRALVQDATNIDPSFENLKKYASKLTIYYVETRYPIFEEFEKFTQKQADEALEFAEKIATFVESKIK